MATEVRSEDVARVEALTSHVSPPHLVVRQVSFVQSPFALLKGSQVSNHRCVAMNEQVQEFVSKADEGRKLLTPMQMAVVEPIHLINFGSRESFVMMDTRTFHSGDSLYCHSWARR